MGISGAKYASHADTCSQGRIRAVFDRTNMTRRSPTKKLESHYQEIVKKYIAKKYGCATVRELNFGGPKFDVVGFSPESGEFHIVECKRTHRLAGVGQTFGQILAYKSMIFESGQTFLNAFLKQLAKEGITDVPIFANVAQFLDAGRIPIRFYVALRERACLSPEFLKLMKKDLKDVGIIRINPNDQCRNYIRVHSAKDHQLCEAGCVEVPISIPPRPALQRLLDNTGSSQEVARLATNLDSRIRRMSQQMKSVVRGKYAMAYRVTTTFVLMHPKKEFIRMSLKNSSHWKQIRIAKKAQIRRIVPRIRKALQRSLSM